MIISIEITPNRFTRWLGSQVRSFKTWVSSISSPTRKTV